MNCDEVMKKRDLYLDREVDTTAHTTIEQHLGQCTGCRDMYTLEGKLRQLMKASAEKTAAPQTLRERIEASLLGMEPQTQTRSTPRTS